MSERGRLYLLIYLICFGFSFAEKPAKGVKFLQENGLLGPDPIDVAKFFLSDDRLDKVI